LGEGPLNIETQHQEEDFGIARLGVLHGDDEVEYVDVDDDIEDIDESG
jgi:hypothetical protein